MNLIQTVFIDPFLKTLAKSGVPLDKHLRSVGLDRFKAGNPMAFLPSTLVLDLFESVDRAEFSSDAASDLNGAYKMSNMGHWGDAILGSPDLLSAAVLADTQEMSIISFNRIDLKIDGPVASMIDRYECERSRAIKLVESLSMALMLDAMVRFGGKGCRPLRIRLTEKRLPEIDVNIDLSQTEIWLNQPLSSIDFPTSWLANSPNFAVAGPESQPSFGPGVKTCERLALYFAGLQEGTRPSLRIAAQDSGVATRTLQRKLQEEGTSFFELLDTWSMSVALKAIEVPCAISELSEKLGYSEPAHFTRAFKRWTGETPNKYREKFARMQ